ncbi:MAG: acyltransferase [Muribaculaceae bacterium]|nr:acyltransferase [Muribaculaceae bacterium]
MNLKRVLRKLVYKITGKSRYESSEAYVNYLRSKGVKIGEGTIVNSPKNIQVDITRPELLEIGKRVLLHRGTVIMTHDFASRVFVNKYNDFVPSHGKIKIGDNVWLGEHVTILKDVEIGDNVIIGSGAVVTKSIPSNSVAVGIPARVVCSLEDYYNKRKEKMVDEAIEYALAIYAAGRIPTVSDFDDDYPTFVDGSNYQEYNYPYMKVFKTEQFEEWKKNHKAPFHGFEEFMKYVEQKRGSR